MRYALRRARAEAWDVLRIAAADESVRMLAVAIAVVLLAWTTAGCGASPLRQHATGAHVLMATMAGADLAIRTGTRHALARCPADDGVERAACIGSVELHATAAAAARDVLIMPVHVYRDGVLATGGEEDPGALAFLGVLALGVLYDWAPFAAAMRALGVPVPDLPAILGGLTGGAR
jgi:hypothetical protein